MKLFEVVLNGTEIKNSITKDEPQSKEEIVPVG
jgi:hypothetical protein